MSPTNVTHVSIAVYVIFLNWLEWAKRRVGKDPAHSVLCVLPWSPTLSPWGHHQWLTLGTHLLDTPLTHRQSNLRKIINLVWPAFGKALLITNSCSFLCQVLTINVLIILSGVFPEFMSILSFYRLIWYNSSFENWNTHLSASFL